MQMTIGNVVIDADVEATRTFYASAPRLLVPCDCPGCRNFCQVIRSMPKEARTLLEQLGIDPENPAEQWVMCAGDNGHTGVYNIFWHLCGRIIGGEEEQMLPVPQEEPFVCAVSTMCGLVPDSFPRPVLQLDMNMRLPWALDEPNTY